jgi:hypothetical protein
LLQRQLSSTGVIKNGIAPIFMFNIHYIIKKQ